MGSIGASTPSTIASLDSVSTPTTPLATTIHLPVINLSSTSPDNAANTLAAASKYGFLYISPQSTGFTSSQVSSEFSRSQNFFSLPISQKSLYAIDHTDRGYSAIGGETLDPSSQTDGATKKGDAKELINIGEFTGAGVPQQDLPESLTGDGAGKGWLEEHWAFERTCQRVCDRVMELLAVGLGVEDPQFFTKRHSKPSGCTVRWLHYPAQTLTEDGGEDVVRAGAHSDYGSVTLLFQRLGQPGLEIKTPEGEWKSVPVVPEGWDVEGLPEEERFPPILVNIGDLLSYWTNGVLRSTVHRVVFPKDLARGGQDRYSIAYFCHPAHLATLEPVPSKMVQEVELGEDEDIGYGGGVTKGKDAKTLTAKEHLMRRLNATYGHRKL